MIGILDYGIGNVGSIQNMLKKAGAASEIVHTADTLSICDKLILPGVGAFDEGMNRLEASGMRIALDAAVAQGKPVLGICLGMQIAVIEYARHVCGLAGAHSSEFDANSPHPVIDLMEEQKSITQKGGTMRLGAYPCITREGTLLRRLYGQERISERHRHRYEFNNAYRDILTSMGLVICGTSPDNKLVEAVELPTHRFFIGVQYHPEFKSRPTKPHPLFLGLLKAALNM